MPASGELLGIYLHLARASEARNRPLIRDKLLVLAGAVAAEYDLAPIAAACRSRVLANNPGHLIGRYPSMVEALADERFQRFLARLRTRYSRERAEHMLQSLGIQLAQERAAYFNDYEYAASLLGLPPEPPHAELRPASAVSPPATSEDNPYVAPRAPLAIKQRPLVLGDRWLAIVVILALVIAPLAMMLLIGVARWLGLK